ncbi:MAG: OprO/OprP family phosphate-selective porin, partial [Planctomycetales bacterium]|nr:OprO/OprP family phosphate-selective porin [Planctomycetales bacterium]
VSAADGFAFSSIRLRVDGTISERFGFKVEGDFAGAPALTDGFAEAQLLGKAVGVRAGQWKVPVGAEWLCPNPFELLVDVSPLRRIAPGRSPGAALRGSVLGGGIEYEAGAWNGSAANSPDDGDQKDVGGRVVFSPLKALGAGGPFAFALGASATRGNQHEVLVPDLTTPSTGTRFLDWDAAVATGPGATTGALLDGPRTRAGLEATLTLGPLAAQGELLWTRTSLSETSAALGRVEATAILWGWLAQVSLFFTEEDAAPYRRPSVKRPTTAEHGGPGAVQLAARVAEWRLDGHALARGMASAENGTPTNTSTDRLVEVAGGLSWWPIPAFRVAVEYAFVQYQDRIRLSTAPGRSERRENAILVRVQVDF